MDAAQKEAVAAAEAEVKARHDHHGATATATAAASATADLAEDYAKEAAQHARPEGRVLVLPIYWHDQVQHKELDLQKALAEVCI